MKPSLFYLLLYILLTVPGISFAAGDSGSQEPVNVTLRPLSELIIHPRDDAPATVLSLNDSMISPEVSGKITAIPVEVGQVVEEGDVIARLDPWLYRAQLQQARGMLRDLTANLNLAKRERKRAEQLRQKGQSTEAVLDAKVAAVERLSAQLAGQRSKVEESRIRLEKSTITAPYSGVVSQRSAQVGGWVAPGASIIHLVDIAKVELSADVSSQRVGQLEQAVELQFVHLGRAYPVRIRSLLPIEKPTTRTREVRLTFAGELPPVGASGRLTWTDRRSYLPPWVLVRRDGGLGLFLEEGGRARFLPLPEAGEGLPALLPDGVAGRVVIKGREALIDDSPLTILPAVD